jgi:hypothetical protein
MVLQLYIISLGNQRYCSARPAAAQQRRSSGAATDQEQGSSGAATDQEQGSSGAATAQQQQTSSRAAQRQAHLVNVLCCEVHALHLVCDLLHVKDLLQGGERQAACWDEM